MNKNAGFVRLIVSVTVMFSICSCYVTNGPYEPYIVPSDRQKDNSYHSPSIVNAPLLSQKNDASLALHFAFLSQHTGVDVQAAFIPVNHLGLQASFRSYKQKGEDIGGKIESFHVGAGYVKDWGNYLFETYGGIGGGNTSNVHHTGISDIHFTSYYLQPAFGFQTKNKQTQFALFAKLSPTKFEIRDTTFAGEREPIVARQFAILAENPNRLFLEPGFIFRTGGENIMFQTAFSYASLLSGEEFIRDKTNFSIGLVLRFNAGSSAGTPKK